VVFPGAYERAAGPFFFAFWDSMVNAVQLTTLLAPAIKALGLECLGVECAQHSHGGLLRVYIDAPGRLVNVEDCETASREISTVLDANDPISGHYTLEVSSPGIDRPLFTLAHYARCQGECAKISVQLPIAGRRRFQGAILRVEANQVTIDQDGSAVALAFENIEKGRLHPAPLAPVKPRSPSKARAAAKPQKPTPPSP